MARRLMLIAALPLALTAAALPAKDKPTGEAALAKAIDGREAGKPVGCVSLAQLRGSESIRGTAIVYRSAGSMLYVNRPRGGSPEQLDNDTILVTRTPSSQLCRNDVVNLVDRMTGFQRGFVILGDFVPYKRLPKAS
jgi:hypothetical protein